MRSQTWAARDPRDDPLLTAGIPPAITTPDKWTRASVSSSTVMAHRTKTVEKVYDNLDTMHASEAFLNAFLGASLVAARKGFIAAGVDDNTVSFSRS